MEKFNKLHNKPRSLKVKDLDFTFLPFSYNLFKRLSKKSQYYWVEYLKRKTKKVFKKFKVDKRI